MYIILFSYGFRVIKKYIRLITQNAPKGLYVYVCEPYAYSPQPLPQISDTMLNAVFVRLHSGWIYMTNINNVSTDRRHVGAGTSTNLNVVGNWSLPWYDCAQYLKLQFQPFEWPGKPGTCFINVKLT